VQKKKATEFGHLRSVAKWMIRRSEEKKMSRLATFLLLAFASIVVGHPSPSLRDTPCLESSPKFYSYHIHVLFNPNNVTSINAALALRQNFMAVFNVSDQTPCDDSNTTHGQYIPLCMVDFDYPIAACPFPTTEWAAYVPPEDFAATVPWFMNHQTNHGEFDIVVHPNSGCEVYDHRDWLMWIGNKWELNTTCLHYNCPGCNMDDCIAKGDAAMFSNMASQCGLKPGAGSRDPFELVDLNQFCSTQCYNWASALTQMPEDCPSHCDLYTKQPSQFDTCEQHLASIPEIVDWTTQCFAPLVALHSNLH
jgi:aromatic ring-cleaving dioxygenase